MVAGCAKKIFERTIIEQQEDVILELSREDHEFSQNRIFWRYPNEDGTMPKREFQVAQSRVRATYLIT